MLAKFTFDSHIFLIYINTTIFRIYPVEKHGRDHINHIHIPVFRIYHTSAISRTSKNGQHILDHTQNTDQQQSIGSPHYKAKQFIQSLYNRKPCQDPQGKNDRF